MAGFSPGMEGLTDRLANDLEAAFPELVAACQDELHAGLRRLASSPTDAADLVQETFYRAYRALAGYPTEQIVSLRLRPWMWTIALNLGRNHLRSRSRRPTLPLDHDQPSWDPEPADSQAWDRRLRFLSPPGRKAVVLRHAAGLDFADIAELLGRPEATVRSDVSRALQKLRTIIEEEK